MVKLRVFFSYPFSKSIKLRIVASSVTLSMLFLVIYNFIDSTHETFGIIYMLLFYGNIVLWIYVYFIHNARIDLIELKREAKKNKTL